VTSPFDNSPDTDSMRREGESSSGERLVHVGMASCPILIDQMILGRSAEVPESSVEVLEYKTVVVEDGGASTQDKLRVYARRRKQNEEIGLTVTLVSVSSLS
jgi:hypothetical protein